MSPKKQKKTKRYTGTINVTSRGTGYVPIEGFEEDIEIPAYALNTALNGDVVSIDLESKKGRRQAGKVKEVVERAKTEFVGTIEKENGQYILIPDDKKIHTNFSIVNFEDKLSSGTKILVHLLEWTNPNISPNVEIKKILGKGGDHEVEMQSIVLERGFDTSFPPDVEREANVIAKEKESFLKKEIPKRRDLREDVTFTIDPYDAKDFDDSISVKKLPDGNIEIGVHIADVSAYVKEGSAIDIEARKRGTSVYLVDRTIPMLPEVLSNDLCSLNPNEDKLTFSAIFTVGKNSEIKDCWFGRTITNSDRRFTYSEAQQILDEGKGDFFEELSIADTLSKVFRKKRLAKGGIAFEQDEVKFKLDDKGKPIDVFVKERIDTNLLIEDFMLLANREVPKYIYKSHKKNFGKDPVFIYRIHDEPDRDRIDQLAIFLKAAGHELNIQKGKTVSSKSLNSLFREIEGTPEENLIQTATIRSMARAVYSTKNIGHFGLAFDYYTNFTSPIRRYPDLLVHRILARFLDKNPIPQKEYNKYEGLTLHSSDREAAAVEAERASIKYKQVEYMKDHIGEEFDGVITGITEWGVFVEESKTKAEGMIRISDLKDDYYELDKHGYGLSGKKTKKKYSLGDTVKIKLVNADLEEKTIDWKLM